MKKSAKNVSTIALAAVALVLSGGFSMAGDFVDLDQNDNGPRGGGLRKLVKPTSSLVPVSAGQYFDIDQNDNGNRGGGDSRRHLVKPRPETAGPVEELKSDRFVGICLNFPIGGQLICWN